MSKTRKRIKKAAYKCFAKKGYSASLDDIAKKVGIKAPSLYAHFGSKEDLFYEVIKEEIESYFIDLEKQFKLLDGQSVHDQVSGIFFSAISYFKDKHRARFWRNIPLVKESQLRNKCRQLIQHNDARYTKRLIEIFNQGVENQELRATVDEGSVYLWLALVQGMLDGMLLYEDNPIDMQSYALKAWEAFWNGIKY